MNCPACQKEMTEKDFGGVKVDVCDKGCKSIWFDWHELTKLDESHEGAGVALLDAIDDPRTNDEGRGQLPCPKCGLAMHIHKYHSAKEVNIDECYACGGIFLDSGELTAIRDNFMSEEERAAYADKLVSEVNGYEDHLADLEKRKLRAQALMQATKFLRPVSENMKKFHKKEELKKQLEEEAQMGIIKDIVDEHKKNDKGNKEE
jgi:hypothetical protein